MTEYEIKYQSDIKHHKHQPDADEFINEFVDEFINLGTRKALDEMQSDNYPAKGIFEVYGEKRDLVLDTNDEKFAKAVLKASKKSKTLVNYLLVRNNPLLVVTMNDGSHLPPLSFEEVEERTSSRIIELVKDEIGNNFLTPIKSRVRACLGI